MPYTPKLPRPTKKTGEHRRGFPYENGGRHWHLWVGLGDVAGQIQLRVWRLEFSFTFWRSYDP